MSMKRETSYMSKIGHNNPPDEQELNIKHPNGRICLTLDDLNEDASAVTVPWDHPLIRTQIEDGIWDICKILNDNNFTTYSSCQGHTIADPLAHVNIKFDNLKQLVLFLDLIKDFKYAAIYDTINDLWFKQYQSQFNIHYACRIKFNGNKQYNLLRLIDVYLMKSWYAKRMFIRHVQNKLSS